MQNDRVRVRLPGFDAAVAPWGTLRLIDFNLVHTIEVRPAVWRRAPVQDLHLRLQTQNRQPLVRVHVCFRGATNVRISNTRHVFLGLFDVSSRGWEDVFYEAEDDEGVGFKLACRDVDLLAVTMDLVPADDLG